MPRYKDKAVHIHRAVCGGDLVSGKVSGPHTTLCGVQVRVVDASCHPQTNVLLNTVEHYVQHLQGHKVIIHDRFCKNCVRRVSPIDILANTNIGE